MQQLGDAWLHSQLLAQIADIRLHNVRETLIVIVPDMFEQLRFRQHLVGMAQEVLQQSILAWGSGKAAGLPF